MTLGGSHLLSEIIALCGGRNIFSDIETLAPQVELETVLARDPDMIIMSGAGHQNEQWRDQWQQFKSMKAVSRGLVESIHPDSIQRPTLRIVEGAAELCALIEKARTVSQSR